MIHLSIEIVPYHDSPLLRLPAHGVCLSCELPSTLPRVMVSAMHVVMHAGLGLPCLVMANPCQDTTLTVVIGGRNSLSR